MEICYLNCEIIKDEYEEFISENKSDSLRMRQPAKAIYNPTDNSIEIYSMEDNLIISKKITTIKQLSNFIKDNKIAFQENNDLIIIYYDKKDTIESKSFSFIQAKLLKELNTKRKEEHTESKRILSTPKDYQLEILELAKKQNTIVFLETGLGKTYISILLIKNLYGEPIDANCRLRLSYPKKTQKKVIFLFKTISLLLQQTKVLKHNLNLRIIKLYGGQDSQNTHSFPKFRSIIEKNDIICGTPETIYRYFTFGYLTQDDVCLIVLDECHHAKDKDYFNLIMKHFILIDDTNEVKVLGLTASPSFDGEKTEDKIKENIQTLCDNLNCHLSCPSNIFKELELNDGKTIDGLVQTNNLPFILDKEIKFILLSKFKFGDKETDVKVFIVEEILFQIILTYLNIKNYFHSELLECVYIASLFCGLITDEEKISEKQNGIFDKSDFSYFMNSQIFKSLPMFKTFLERFKLELDKGEEKINFNREMRDSAKLIKEDQVLKEIKKYTKNINLIIKYLEIDSISTFTLFTFDSIKSKLFEIFYKHECTDIINTCYLKIKQLPKHFNYASPYLNAVKDFFDQIILNISKGNLNNPKSILFSNHRLITKLLNDKLNKYLNLKGFSSTFVVGCQSQATIAFSEEELKANIDYFATEDKCLVLFATDVVEEGIDIPQCNNIINLSEIKTIKEFIQKSGRARMKDSRIYLFASDEKDVSKLRNSIDQIKIATRVMKHIVIENKIKPNPKKEKFIENLNYYQTKTGARVYLSYAKKLVEEFLGKLFFDGYSFLKATLKFEEKIINVVNNSQTTHKTLFSPFLSLPSVLESNFTRIFDSDDVQFSTKEEARKYFEKHEDHYYLKAVKLLHLNKYLDDHFIFTKHYDELINLENSSSKFPSEPQLILKADTSGKNDFIEEFIELKAHIIDLSPKYIDINFNNKGHDSNMKNDTQILTIISENPVMLTNFDIFIHSTLLIKLYFFNNFDQSEENQIKFLQKPKIPYNVFTKINLSIINCVNLRIKRDQIDLINFFYTYILYFSTDAELLFYHSVFCQKFDFSQKLFLDDIRVKNYLKFIFERYSSEELKKTEKIHLSKFDSMNPNYSNHLIKFSILKYNNEEETFFIDFEYIESILLSVKKNIQSYYYFLKNCVQTAEEIQKMSKDENYLFQKEDELREFRQDYDHEEPEFGSLCRNLINYSKYFILNFGQTDLRGQTKYKNKEYNYQTYYLDKYGVLTDNYRDYKKYLPLDYNQKVLKYKINIKQLGKVAKHFGKTHYLKKFQFLPNEIIQGINVITPDQMHLFTIFPVILHKIQHSLIYYYQAFCLRQRFESFRALDYFNIKLLMQALTAKSTMECENYERLEFLGDSVLKLLSSLEVSKIYPDANRDLLFSKRKLIENNKSLYTHALSEKNKLHEFLFTSPLSVKRVMIPGFSQDDSLIFNIGYNRSFAKYCFNTHKGEVNIKIEDGKEVTHDKDKFEKNLGLIKEGSVSNYQPKEEDVNLDLIDEEKTEKTAMKVEYEDNPDPVYNNTDIYIDENIINTVVNKRIEIIPNKSFRILNNKVFADIIESLVGFLLHYSYSEGKLFDLFKQSSNFLKELSVLQFSFDYYICEEYWLQNLLNPNCRFNNSEKYNKVKPIAENKRYTFRNIELLYQACTHPSYLTEESMKANFPYVKKSYQRLAFLGEAFLSFYVSLWVYLKNPEANECLLHKLKICGINHHIISLIAIDLKLDDCLLKNDRDIDFDIKIYKNKFYEMRQNSSNRYRVENESILDDNFIIILCEMLHAYIGAILLDSRDIEKTFFVVKGIMDEYLVNNATVITYHEHPKVIILDEFKKRAHYLKSLRENGSNRVNLKNEKGEKFRKLKMYKYQLVIDDFIIYEEFIYYNRSTIKIAQEKAKDNFLKICQEIDRREKMGLNSQYFDLKAIIDFLEMPYEKYKLK